MQIRPATTACGETESAVPAADFAELAEEIQQKKLALVDIKTQLDDVADKKKPLRASKKDSKDEALAVL